ncbi:hypothetical protein CROQUDRAFT_667151, partial [Cronartium quercuum f. sp. fusiforme G11]
MQGHPKPSAGNVAPGHPFSLPSPSTSFHNPCDSLAPTLPHHFLPIQSPWSPVTAHQLLFTLLAHHFISICQKKVS